MDGERPIQRSGRTTALELSTGEVQRENISRENINKENINGENIIIIQMIKIYPLLQMIPVEASCCVVNVVFLFPLP